jgi:ataxin-3
MLDGNEGGNKTQDGSEKESDNISAYGNYSLELLAGALEGKGMELREIDIAYKLDNDINNETAFLCHLSSHWFAVRKVSGAWFLLDSLKKEPYKLTDTYFKYLNMKVNSTYMNGILKQGGRAFIVKGGNLKEPEKDVCLCIK